MFTSRAEFRLHLRIDNADRRLTPYGRRIGLISDQGWNDFLAKQQRMDRLRAVLESSRVTAPVLDEIRGARIQRVEQGFNPAATGQEDDAPSARDSNGRQAIPECSFDNSLGSTLAQLLKRPDVSIEDLELVLRSLAPDFFQRDKQRDHAPVTQTAPPSLYERITGVAALDDQGRTTDGSTDDPSLWIELKSVETEIKYAGYLDQQRRAIERLKKAEQRNIPDWFDYASVSGLSREMKEKLQRVRPRTLAQASRIPGVTPAAVSLVNVYIEIQSRRHSAAESLTS
jgi:tRNA uridine 5-carboxymethylaminomethyl modification enzyme